MSTAQNHAKMVTAQRKAQAKVDQLWNEQNHLRVLASTGSATDKEREQLAQVKADYKIADDANKEAQRLVKILSDELTEEQRIADKVYLAQEAERRARLATLAHDALHTDRPRLSALQARVDMLELVGKSTPVNRLPEELVAPYEEFVDATN